MGLGDKKQRGLPEEGWYSRWEMLKIRQGLAVVPRPRYPAVGHRPPEMPTLTPTPDPQEGSREEKRRRTWDICPYSFPKMSLTFRDLNHPLSSMGGNPSSTTYLAVVA